MRKIKKISNMILGFTNRVSQDHISAYAAQSAYFILLSFIPFILLLMTSVRYTPLTQSMILEAVIRSVPLEFQNFIKGIILEVYSRSLAVVPITAIITLWTAGKGLQGLTNGLNSIYQVFETRNYVAARIRSAAYTLAFILIIIAMLILQVFGKSIQAALVEHFPFISEVTSSILQMSTPISLVVLSAMFLMMYKFLPNRRASFKSQLPGAMISSAAWSGFSLGFSAYLEYFGVSNMYGSLTTLIMIMLWMYFCMFIFLLGAEVNAYFEDKFRKFQQAAVEHLRMEVQNLTGGSYEAEDDSGAEDKKKPEKN